MKTARLLSSPEAVVKMMATLDELQLPAWWSGLCIWINTGKGTHSPELGDKETAALLRMGYEWSAKKGAWYLRADEGIELPADAPRLNMMACIDLDTKEAAA